MSQTSMQSSCAKAPIALRLAHRDDIASLEALIALSARTLQAAWYSAAQIEGALGTVFAVDTRLIDDGTYFVAEHRDELVGCGGWSKRKTLFGGSRGRDVKDDALLDPALSAARIRAFFVHPEYARRGIGTSLIEACECAASTGGFTRMELAATLAGEPLYAAFGYEAIARDEIPLVNGLMLPIVRMGKRLGALTGASDQ